MFASPTLTGIGIGGVVVVSRTSNDGELPSLDEKSAEMETVVNALEYERH